MSLSNVNYIQLETADQHLHKINYHEASNVRSGETLTSDAEDLPANYCFVVIVT